MQQKTTLNRIAQLATSPDVSVQVDSEFIGRLGRDDGWSVTRWQLPWQVLFLVHEGTLIVETSRRTVQAVAGQ
ncbi:MAG: hypothetical protein JKX85_07785, partial [Phycisphaeraceae bacterium]|nr:hypothetical protein [Phycisphaeraceae bacterium]